VDPTTALVVRHNTEGDDDVHGLNTVIHLVLDSVPSPYTKQAYRRALLEFFAWLRMNPGLGFSKATVQKYRGYLEGHKLAPSTLNVKLSALRRLAVEAADNGLIAPELANGITRIKSIRRRGLVLGNWLSCGQAEQLLRSPDLSTTKGKRDFAALAILIGCGLRRGEASRVRFEHLHLRDGRWVIVDLLGKHQRVRSVPMPMWTKAAIDGWAVTANLTTGCILRPVDKTGRVTADCLSPQSIFKIVREYATAIGGQLAPHDLRRTHAKLAHKGGAALEQIRFALGHSSIKTTEIYLGLQQDLADGPCDHLGIQLQV
jgi:site-specific recombinase XerD